MFVFVTRESLAQICDAAAFSVLAVLALIMIDAVVVFGALDLLAFVSPADFVTLVLPSKSKTKSSRVRVRLNFEI